MERNPTPDPAQPSFSTSKEYSNAQSLVKWVVGFLLILQAKYHIPNAAIDLLIKFMFALFCVLGRFSPLIRQLNALFPSSLHVMRKSFNTIMSFNKYPVCPKCSKVYTSFECCIEKVGSKQSSKTCSYIAFPTHPHRSRRTPCKAALLKSVEYRSGKKFLYPFKVYCYCGLTAPLQKLLLTPSFLKNCELWRSRPISNVLSDVYDGKIWKEFSMIAGSEFLAAPFTYICVDVKYRLVSTILNVVKDCPN